VSLVSFAGNLGMNSGAPQSVYQLDTNGLHQLPVKPRPLATGQSIKLPDGAGTLTFTGYRQWISLAITYDPGQLPALIAAIVALAGLLISFLVRRRRVFIRVHAQGNVGGAAGSELAPRGAAGSELAEGEAAGSELAERSTIEFGGLPRTESSETFEAEFADLAAALATATGSSAEAASEPARSAASIRPSSPTGRE
jgi:cytochrome c biogenesis protein